MESARSSQNSLTAFPRRTKKRRETQCVTIAPATRRETPFRREGRKMSKRSGQCGQVFVRNGRYVGRFNVDTPERRIRKAVVLGLKSEMTKPAAKRRLLEMIASEGINAPTYLERALVSAKTFND